jgi:hypothetical protein
MNGFFTFVSGSMALDSGSATTAFAKVSFNNLRSS